MWYRLNFPTKAEVKRARERGALLTDEDKAAARAAAARQGPSMYRGVSWTMKECCWKTIISHDGKSCTLGHYHDEREAALAASHTMRLRGGCAATLRTAEGPPTVAGHNRLPKNEAGNAKALGMDS